MSIPLAPTRRQFTLGLAGAALAFPDTGNRIYNPLLALHTSVWLAEAGARKKRPGEILDEALAVTHHAGFRRVELATEFVAPAMRERTLSRLERLGLEPSIVCCSGVVHTRDSAAACRDDAASLARFFAGRAAFIAFCAAPAPGGRPKTDAELDTQAYQLNLMGQEVQQAGGRLLIEHELPEMADGAREWRHMLANTEARFAALALDIESAARAGANPWNLIDTAAARLRNIHVRNSRHGADQGTLGDGDINLEVIAKLLREERYDGYLTVELRRPRDPEFPPQRSLPESLSMSRWYMQQVFGSRPGGFPVDMGPHIRPKK